MSQIHYPDFDEHHAGNGSRFPVRTLTARVLTLVSLIVSAAVIKTNDVTLVEGYAPLTYADVRSYKYMFYISVIGVIYTVLQIPFAIYYLRTKKLLISSFSFLKLSFYADKVMAFLLATGAGAAFGATMDLKKVEWVDYNSKRQDFLTMAYVPSAFLLVGAICCAISSVHSSMALTKTT